MLIKPLQAFSISYTTHFDTPLGKGTETNVALTLNQSLLFKSFIFQSFVMTPNQKLGFGRTLAGILPTKPPDLHIQLKDLRNNQESQKRIFGI